MKSIMSAIAIVVLAGLPAQAQENTDAAGALSSARHRRRPISTATAAMAQAEPRLQEAPARSAAAMLRAAAGQSLGCINERLKRQVDRVNPPVTNTPPIDAKSQDLKVGVVNVPAVQQQYGRNFGVSAFPYRPPAPVYTSPVGHR